MRTLARHCVGSAGFRSSALSLLVLMGPICRTVTGQNAPTPPPQLAQPGMASIAIPPDAIAYYRLDPSPFDTTSAALLPLALQLAEQYGLVDPEFHPLFDGILAASAAGSVPHTLCLLDFDGRFESPGARGFRIQRLAAILVLETQRDHRRFVQILANILPHYGKDAGQSQEIIELPGGRQGARFHADGWEPWQTVEWASLADSFVVGLGHGSIERWIAAQPENTDGNGGLPDFLQRHRDSVSRADDERRRFGRDRLSRRDEEPAEPPVRFLEIWVNLDRLHEVMPDILAQGLIRQMLVTWKLDNARSWMLHGRWQERFLLADLTWQSRSEPETEVRHRSLTLDRWPDDLTLPQPPGEYVVVVPMDFQAAFERILQTYRATIKPERIAEFDKKMRSYRARTRGTYSRLWAGFRPYLILSNHPRPVVAVPGATTLYFELRNRVSPARTQALLVSLLETFMDSPDPSRLGDSVVRRDKENRLFWLQLESTGTLKTPAWGWEGPYLFGGWGPPVVTVNREWIRQQKRR